MTSMVIAPPPSRPRPPPDPPPRKLPLLGSLSPFEPLEPPDPPDPLDVSPALHRFTFTSPKRRLSSAFHLTSVLKLTRRPLPSSSPKMMNFLPPGKIDSTWFWCRRGSDNSPLCSLLARSMSLKGSQHYHRTLLARNLLFDEPPTKPCSLQTPFVATHTGDCSPYLSVSDLNDQRLSLCSIKPLLLQHGNAGVGRLCVDAMLVPSEVGVNPISLSASTKNPVTPLSTYLLLYLRRQLLESLKDSQSMLNGVFVNYLAVFVSNGAVHYWKKIWEMKTPMVETQRQYRSRLPYYVSRFNGFFSEPTLKSQSIKEAYLKLIGAFVGFWTVIALIKQTPSASTSTSLRTSVLHILEKQKLISNSLVTSSRQDRERSVLQIPSSPLATFPTALASQISSCRGHERSSFSILLLVGVNLSTKIPLYERYMSLGVKAYEYFRFLNCLLSCVMVRLGPENSTRLIPVRLEVVERSMSRYTVTIIKSENFEGRRLFACGSFDKLGHSIKLPKFVSLSLFALFLIFSKGSHIALFNVAFVHVTF
ncbi:Uncharacterized protein Rs2_10112 [Raphanus sativus]|nr:Uncharacterized protein Rs2_10112 [Raphanus sativus]